MSMSLVCSDSSVFTLTSVSVRVKHVSLMCVCMYVDMCMYVYVYVKRLELFSRLGAISSLRYYYYYYYYYYLSVIHTMYSSDLVRVFCIEHFIDNLYNYSYL